MIRGRVVIVAKALSPIHHGGDTVGNVSTFRKHDVFVDGVKSQVPYISGNTIKSQNRRAGAAFAVEAMGLAADKSLNRNEVHLMRSGGALTKSGSSVRIDKARNVASALPFLGLHGYAAGSMMQESVMSVDLMEPVCAETRHKYRREIEKYLSDDDKYLVDEPASELLREYNEYSRDGSRDRAGFQMMSDEDQAELAEQLAKNESKDPLRPMPHTFECLIPGTVLIGGFNFANGISEDELQAWRSAIFFSSEGVTGDGGLLMTIGGKGARGFGKVSVHLYGMLAEGIQPMKFYDTQALIPGIDPDAELKAFAATLKENKDAAREALKEVLG